MQEEGAEAGLPGSVAGASGSWWTHERARLHEWLEKTAPELAAVYSGGLRILMEEEFPGRVRFAAHAMREIANRLRDVLADTDAKRPQYGVLVEGVRKRWVEEGLPIGDREALRERALPSASGPEAYGVSRRLLWAVAKLVDEHAGAPPTNRQRLRGLFHEVCGPDPPAAEVVESWVESWMSVTERGVGLAHVGNEPLRPDAEGEAAEMFFAFERSLIAIANRSFENLDALDRLLGSANRGSGAWYSPTEDELAEVRAFVIRPENRRYFFDRLENPNWVPPLAQRGYFGQPPEPVPSDEVGFVRYPPWPEGRYLARMAPDAPDAVAEVLGSLPQSSNPAATRLVLEALDALPDSQFGELARRVAEWVAAPGVGFFDDQAASAVARLFRSAFVEEGLSAARALLALESRPAPLRAEPVGRCSPWGVQARCR